MVEIHRNKAFTICVSLHAARGETGRERAAGAGERTPRGPGDPALEATQRAGGELPTGQTHAGKEGRDALARGRRWSSAHV